MSASGADVLEQKGRYDVEQVEIKRIIPTRDNPRWKVRTDTQDFKELVASIRDMGIMIPLLGRPDPEREGMIDLRAGARRFAAAIEAGLATVPVIVREMDDRTAIKVTVLENKDRADLSPIEQARGYRLMLDRGGFSAAEIASEMGCSETFVLRRAKLADLAPEWVAAIQDEASNYFTWHAGHMEMVARFDKEVQLRIKAHLDKFGVNRSLRVKDLEHALADFTRNLAGAAWDLTDAELFPKAGACSECPKRNCCRPGLFEPIEEDRKAPVLCLDAGCWKKKERIFLERQLRAAREAHPDAVTLKRGYGPGSGDYHESDVLKAKKGDKGAVPAVVTSGPGKGSVTWVKLKKPAAVQKPAAPTVGEARKVLSIQRHQFIEQQIIEAFQRARTLPKGMASAEKLLAAFAAAFCGWGNQERKQTVIFRAKGKKLLAAAWDALRFMELETRDGESSWPPAVFAVIAGADPKKLAKEAEEKFPQPASWKGLKDTDPEPPADAAGRDADSSGNGAAEG